MPGDVINVPDNAFLPCDFVLLTGQCIVNESMLTGESVPVIKNSLSPSEDYFDLANEDSAKKSILYSGTKVIQARNTGGQSCIALVIRTGFVTTKGSLVRDILYPKPVNFKFYRESIYFVFAMSLVALIGFAATFN